MTSDRLGSFLEALASDGDLALGIQLSVRSGDEEQVYVVGCGGTGALLRPDSLLRLYCAAKPVLAYTYLDWLLRREVALEVPIGELVDGEVWPASIARYSVRDLMLQATHLISPKGLDVLVLGDVPLRERIAAEAERSPIDAVGYSEVATWTIVADLIEGIRGGAHAAEIVRAGTRRLGPVDLAFAMTDDEVAAHRSRVHPNASLSMSSPVPLLSETTNDALQRFDPAIGGYGTASGLSMFWSGLGRAIAGRASPCDEDVARLMFHERRPIVFDACLGIHCSFGMGTMVDLGAHWGIPELPKASVGHSGFMGTSFGFSLPDHDVAVGCTVVGITDPETSAGFVRPTIVRACLERL